MKTQRVGRTKGQANRQHTETKPHGNEASDPPDEFNESVDLAPDPSVNTQGGLMAEKEKVSDSVAVAEEGQATEQPSEANQGQGMLATEKPVPSAPEKKTSQYVVTVDNQTGLASKIETLDDETGERNELTTDEYAQVMLYASYSASPFYSAMSAYIPASSSESNLLTRAYYRGVSDYLNALNTTK